MEQQKEKRIERFWDAYRKWEEDVWEEFVEKCEDYWYLGSPDQFTRDADEADGQNVRLVELCEDGTLYYHSDTGTNYVKDFVTPWEESPHYMEV